MTWKQIRDSKYTSPIVRGMKRKERGARDRILADDEIKAVWKAASQESAGAFGAIVRLSLITAQRRDKIASLKWADIDDKGYWTVATEEGEKGNIAKTKLPDVALAIIDAQPRKDDSPYVFASDWTRRRKGEDERREASYFSAWSQGKHGLDKLLPEMPAWTVHDCRRTARSLMARLGVLPHVSERVLGHAMPGTVGVYDRYSYTDEKAAALEKLAGFIDRLVNQPERSNVVEMQKPRRKTKRAKAA